MIKKVTLFNCAVETIKMENGDIELVVYGLNGGHNLLSDPDTTAEQYRTHIGSQVDTMAGESYRGCVHKIDYLDKHYCENKDCYLKCCHIEYTTPNGHEVDACGCLEICPGE